MKPEIKLTLYYLLAGVLWILLSDRFLYFCFGHLELSQHSIFQTIKGLFYVVSTGFILYLLLRRYYRNINQKIEDIKNMNEKLKEQSQQLQLSNESLEQFAFVAAHDLQEPLRSLSTFLSLLQAQYKGKLDEKGEQYIHFSVEGAKRMKQIIYDLYQLSRASNADAEISIINLNEIIAEILENQQALIDEKKAIIHYDKLPQIATYRSAMLRILDNLIGNSLKYHKPGETPDIRIEAIELIEEWQIAVIDKGIGIDPEYFENIFIIFKRLHRNDDIQGTGMGLAIVKKLTESIGGRIWVESTPGNGASFIFTVPK